MAANTTDIVKSGRGDGAVAPSRPAAPAPVNVKIRKVGPVGAFLRPIGISLALLLAAYGLVSLGTTFWR